MTSITKGYIVRSRHFLFQRESKVVVRTVSECKIFVLKLEVLLLLSLQYPMLFDSLKKVVMEVKNDIRWDKNLLDFIQPEIDKKKVSRMVDRMDP